MHSKAWTTTCSLRGRSCSAEASEIPGTTRGRSRPVPRCRSPPRTSQRRRGTGPFPSGGIRPRTTARPPSPTASTAAQMSTTCRPSPTSATCVRMWMETSRTESPTCTVSPSIDTVPPTSQAILTGSASDGYWFRSEVTVSFDASDATSGVASIAYRVDSGVWQAYGAPFDVLDGMHVVESYATDVAGNPEGISRVSFGVDTVAPATGVTLSGPRGENG